MAIDAHKHQGLLSFMVTVRHQDGRLFKGKLLELDEQNLVIEFAPSYVRIIRTAQVADVRVINRTKLL